MLSRARKRSRDLRQTEAMRPDAPSVQPPGVPVDGGAWRWIVPSGGATHVRVFLSLKKNSTEWRILFFFPTLLDGRGFPAVLGRKGGAREKSRYTDRWVGGAST